MSYLIIKCGGSITEKLPKRFYQNIADLQASYQINPIIVHGGGPQLSSLLSALHIETTFIEGLRVTNEAVLQTAEMVLSGTANKKLVRELLQIGARAIGLSGVDGRLLEARLKANSEKLGYVGEIVSVNKSLFDLLIHDSYIPVISPIAADKNGIPLNINADEAAAAIAKAYKASICMITDVSGVMNGEKVISSTTPLKLEEYIQKGVIKGGMVPKVKAAIDSLQQGVKEVVIMNGLEEDGLLKYLSKESIGTLVQLEEEYADA